MQVSGIRAIMAVRDALDRQGLVRTSRMNGGELRGWSPPNHIDHSTMNVRRDADGNLAWRVTISGKPHLRYRKYYEADHDGGTTEMHEPLSPESLFDPVRAAFRDLGLRPTDVEFSGWSAHWDDDVSYIVKTPQPDWLAPRTQENLPPLAPGFATLCTFGVRPNAWTRSEDFKGICTSAQQNGLETLVGYVGPRHEPLLTREAVEALSRLPIREADSWKDIGDGRRTSINATEAFIKLEPGAGTEPNAMLYQRLGAYRGMTRPLYDPPRQVAVAKAEVVCNAWGDEVTVWRFPVGAFQRTAMFEPKQPVLLGGEMRDKVSFREWDAQFGPSPWSPEGIPQASAAPRP
jgi:hypothetical protein